MGTANQDDFQASEGRNLPMVPVGGGWVTLSIPGQGTKLPQALGLKKKKKESKPVGQRRGLTGRTGINCVESD